MPDRQAAEFSRGGEVDLHGAVPAIQPICISGINRVGIKNPGIVDQYIDPAIQPFECVVPKIWRCCWICKVGRQSAVLIHGAMAGDNGLAIKGLNDGLANAPARTGHEHMWFRFFHGCGDSVGRTKGPIYARADLPKMSVLSDFAIAASGFAPRMRVSER